MSVDIIQQEPLRSAQPSTVADVGYKPLRVWPVALLLAIGLVLKLLPSLVQNGPANLWISSAFGPLLCGILLLVWWLAASRASWREKATGFIGVIIGIAVTIALVDQSMRGPAMTTFTIPMGMTAFAITAIACGRILHFRRTLIILLLTFCAFGYSTLLRSDGFWGDFSLGLQWRWTPSSEQRVLASRSEMRSDDPPALSDIEIRQSLADPRWPEFRGPDRTGRQSGSRIASDWSANPPQQLWRISVGPAWSSFAVAGRLLYTQEQRFEMETVVCYDAESGAELWTHEVESRLDDPLGGPGPRATPTLVDNALYVLGAEGFLMRLDPATGDVVWQKDLRVVADRSPPMWGFCSSPLVIDSLVIVYAGGAKDKGTLAFDTETGDLKWSAPAGAHSYSSPQRGKLLGKEYLLMLTDTGLSVLDPATGTERLNYQWKHPGYRSLQPQVIGDDSVLIATGMGTGSRLVRVRPDGDRLAAEEIWTTRNLKPDFNDLVIYQGHAYGFDNAIFTCIDLETGDRVWKGGRYGKGQVLLVNDSGLLLVVSERGDVVLVKATPDGHQELAKIKCLEGKTWNHPVLVGDRLYVRNSQEAACYQLPLDKNPQNQIESEAVIESENPGFAME